LHNLLLNHCNNVTIKGSRFDTSPLGSGIALDYTTDVSVTNCEVARNGYHGITISESKNVSVRNNLIEANDRNGVMAEFLFAGSENITISNNIIQFNNGYGVRAYAVTNNKMENNIYAGNGSNAAQQNLSPEKFIIME
jgi:parallel beta-helix repeat protein